MLMLLVFTSDEGTKRNRIRNENGPSGDRELHYTIKRNISNTVTYLPVRETILTCFINRELFLRSLFGVRFSGPTDLAFVFAQDQETVLTNFD